MFSSFPLYNTFFNPAHVAFCRIAELVVSFCKKSPLISGCIAEGDLQDRAYHTYHSYTPSIELVLRSPAIHTECIAHKHMHTHCLPLTQIHTHTGGEDAGSSDMLVLDLIEEELKLRGVELEGVLGGRGVEEGGGESCIDADADVEGARVGGCHDVLKALTPSLYESNSPQVLQFVSVHSSSLQSCSVYESNFPQALQGVAGCCRVLQGVAGECSVLQCVCASSCPQVLQCDAVCCSTWKDVAVCCSVLQCVAVCCSVLQCATMC